MNLKSEQGQQKSESSEAKGRKKSQDTDAKSQFLSDFGKFLKDLEGLYNEQISLSRAAKYTGVVLRQPSVISPGPLEIPRAREIAPLPELAIPEFNVDDLLKGTRSKEKIDYMTMSTWQSSVDLPHNANLTCVQTQCGIEHWKEMEEIANSLKDAILRVIKPEVEPVDLRNYLSVKPNFETIVRSADAVDPFPSRQVEESELVEVKIRVWSQNLEWLIMLVKSVASQCRIMSDFGHAREPHSAAMAAHLGASLRQRADSLTRMLATFDAYLERFPEAVLDAIEEKILIDLVQKMKSDPTGRSFTHTPVSIAKVIGVGPDKVRACIKEMMRIGELDKQEPLKEGGRVKVTFNLDDAVKIARYCENPKKRK